MTRHCVQHVYVESERAFNEQSKALVKNATNLLTWWSTGDLYPQKWWFLVRALVFHLWWTEETDWSDQQKKMPHCFQFSANSDAE